MSSEKTKTARDRILEVAEDLFYREGIRAVGIDTIIEKSGVAKMSLYRSFASKDELVAAYLELRSQKYWEWWDGLMAQHPGEPRQQLRDWVQGAIERSRRPGYRGCAFVNAATEFPEQVSRARAVALAHKDEMRKRLRILCESLGAAQPRVLADQLFVLIDGANSTAGILGRCDAISAIVPAAELLIDSAVQADPASGAPETDPCD